MKPRSFLSSISVCLTLALVPAASSAGEKIRSLQDVAELEGKVAAVAEKCLPATVALLSANTGSSGSGVITSEDGLILTAAHVVQGAEQLLVVFPDGKQVQGKVLGANYSKDIAMVKIIDKGKWPFVKKGTSEQLKAGNWVIALGHSAGFDAGRTPPIRFGRVVSDGPGNFLTTDCTLIGGDSGGPLFDLDGKLVGIHSSIGRSLTNNNHAGVDGFQDDWERLIDGEAWGRLSMNPFANPEMPAIGIEMAVYRGIPGVLVRSMDPGSPAAAGGVRVGDIIRSLDGSVVQSGGDLMQLLAKRQAGDQIKLGILRDNKSLETTVTLKRRNEVYDAR